LNRALERLGASGGPPRLIQAGDVEHRDFPERSRGRQAAMIVPSAGPGEDAVYVSLARVKTADQPIANATIVGEEMQRWLRDLKGFEGLLMLSREGTTVGLTFWESRDAAERYRALRMQFLSRVTSVADVEIEEIVDYDVTFARLGPLATDSAAE
jgi:hypothetical protein